MERNRLFQEITHLVPYHFVSNLEFEALIAKPTNHSEGLGFYTQQLNANILHNSSKASGRTCNITCVAMVLESLGIKITDTKPVIDRTVLVKIAEAYKSTLNNKDLYSLRFPDFLQILCI